MDKLKKGMGNIFKRADKVNKNTTTILPIRDDKSRETIEPDKPLRASQEEIPADYEIDIRLDQDLTDYESPQAEHDVIDVDIDTKSPSRAAGFHADSDIMTVNPLKTFSNQVHIDIGRMSQEGYINPDDVNSMISHTFRTLKRPILNNVAGKGATVLDNANLIMVTSSFSGEGKTYTAINLAISMAMEKDKNILLIDADASKPTHHEIFGLKPGKGLTDLLQGQVDDVSKIIQKTNIPSLSLMFAGTRTPHATELFASNAMERFVTELSERYDDRVIIFDSAPLLLPTEAGVLAEHMGQVVMVVEAEKTRIEQARQGVDMLSNRVKLIVLNKTREQSGGAYGAYGAYGPYGPGTPTDG
jgi:protein-tyrosine kinase